ncbi:MAG: SGNH/GDSL hydrolase family protein [Terriglobia bacterium]|jgi:lysophospholipase L1-like esterase
MRNLRRALLLFATTLLFAAVALGQGKFALQDGDRVVFYGDSITDQRLYTTFIETYVVTRFPRLKVWFVHSGVGGDRVTGGWAGSIDVRLPRDVIAYKPTVMTVMLGMNDGSYRGWDDGIFKTYSTGYQHIIDTMKRALPGIRITVMQPSPYDDVTRPPNIDDGYNAVLVRYGQFVKELGEREGLLVADLNSPVVNMLEKAKAADPELAKNIIEDRVHPGPGGHLIMAEALLKAWNAPATVAAVEIDAAAGRVTRADNAKVTGLKCGSSLSWTETDGALPMPVDMEDKVMALSVRSSDFIATLDQEPLKVTGLSAARYTLTIDGEKVGSFTKQQLEEGINLATLPTPMAKQAAKVHDLTLKHNDIHFARWRDVQISLKDYKLAGEPAVVDSLDKLEEQIVQLQRTGAKPQMRRYELTAE